MLAVTTRNRLRTPRFCVPMLLARREIARQLSQQPGLIHYASGVASPTEFLTLSVWESRESMQRFMQSGAHERHMWQFTRWTSSFWGMRWEPIPGAEAGAWSAAPLVQEAPRPTPVSPLVSAGLLPATAPRAGPLGPRRSGGAGIEPRAARIVAVTARFEAVSAGQRAWRTAKRLRIEQHSSGKLVRWSVGLDLPLQALAISLWRDEPNVRENALDLLSTELHANWAMCWQPADYEIGHWDGLRLRNLSRKLVGDTVLRGQ
jgi:hypothetical protein